MQRGLRMITLQGAIEKSPILLTQYWKNEWLDGTIIISHFGGSNNIFADYICEICDYICKKNDVGTGRTVTIVQENSESTAVNKLEFKIEYEFLSLPQESNISIKYIMQSVSSLAFLMIICI